MSDDGGALELSTLAQALTATCIPALGPPQLEIANVTITLPSDLLDSKQVIYVDVRCDESLFRTTAQARKFDPLAANKPPVLAFESDRGHLSVATPITADSALFFAVRRCQIFGDSDLCSVHVPIAALPLVKHTPQTFAAGCFTFQLVPLNLGFDPDPAHPPAQPLIQVTKGVRQLNYFESQEELKKLGAKSSTKKKRLGAESSTSTKLPPQQECEPMPGLAYNQPLPPQGADSPSTKGGSGGNANAPSVNAATSPQASSAGGAVSQKAAPPKQQTSTPQAASGAGVAVPPIPTNAVIAALSDEEEAPRPRALFPESAQSALDAFGAPPSMPTFAPPPLSGASSSPVVTAPTGWSDGPLQVIRNEEQLKPLMYRGSIPPQVASPPPGYQRSKRLQQLLKPPANYAVAQPAPSGIGALFGSLASAVVSVAGELSNTVDVELMRTSFPDIRSPLVNTFTPHVLNGHGTPIPGTLYVTTTDVAFDGPLLKFHYPFAAICYIRRTTAFGKDCVQLFCPNHIAYQLQDFDGMVARLGNVTGAREHTSFFNGYSTLLDLWRVSRNLPLRDTA